MLAFTVFKQTIEPTLINKNLTTKVTKMISKTLDVLMVAALLAMDSQAADPVKAPHLDMTFKSNDHNGLRGFYPWWSGDLDDSKCRVAETRKWEKGMPEHYWKQ